MSEIPIETNLMFGLIIPAVLQDLTAVFEILPDDPFLRQKIIGLFCFKSRPAVLSNYETGCG